MAFKISVITATRNRRDFIGRCIESVASQPYADKEHLIVDGGSTDGAVEVIREYAARYPHIRWISEPDNGISDAFNKGLAMMTGDAVGIIGDDDYYEPDVFGSVADEFARHPEVGLISGHLNIFQNNSTASTVVARAAFSSRRELIQCWTYWCKGTLLPAPSTFIRREVIDTVGGFDVADRYAMDYHHWIRITEKFNVMVMDRVLANFRLDDGTVSYSQQHKQWAETLAISRKYWGSKLSREYYSLLFSFWMEYRWPRIMEALDRRMPRWKAARERVKQLSRRVVRKGLKTARRVAG